MQEGQKKELRSKPMQKGEWLKEVERDEEGDSSLSQDFNKAEEEQLGDTVVNPVNTQHGIEENIRVCRNIRN